MLLRFLPFPLQQVCSFLLLLLLNQTGQAEKGSSSGMCVRCDAKRNMHMQGPRPWWLIGTLLVPKWLRGRVPLFVVYKMLFGGYNVPRRWCSFWDTKKNFFGTQKPFFGIQKLCSGCKMLFRYGKQKFLFDQNPNTSQKLQKIKNNQKKEEEK